MVGLILKAAQVAHKLSKAKKAAKAVKKATTKKKAPAKKPSAKYEVVDSQTKQTVGKPVGSLKAASRKVDRLDNAYGGTRYQHRRVKD